MKVYLIAGAMCAALLGLLCGCSGEQAPAKSSEPKEIASFRFTHRGSETSQCFVYAMEAGADGVRLYTEGLYLGGSVVDCIIDETALEELETMVWNHGLDQWDGFSKKAKDVSDGTGFYLSIFYADETFVSAEGSNRFPDGYAEAKAEICELFERLIDQYGSEEEAKP